MFPIDKKKTAMIILSKMGKDQEVKQESESDESLDMYKAFAEDLMQAINDKSVQGVAEVFKSFHELMEEMDEGEDAEEHAKMMSKMK